MLRISPPFPFGQPRTFRATLHGTVFSGRDDHIEQLQDGDVLRLIPDPPVQDAPEVWAHMETGEPIGHLPPDVSWWLWPWMAEGGAATGVLLRVRGREVPSWRRLLLEVSCVTS
ncbi:MAG TPA: hypothetical protein DCY33_01140 [Gemmatimonadetes bacterium]|jgi:hypothetical protein|nr:hypothetical protein [Myxococcales bacterium]HAY76414.1 hypothetical protein [Gemmatimonadota bacterium]